MSIRRKLTLTLLVASLLPVVGLIALVYGLEARQIMARSGREHAHTAAEALDKLDRLLFERYRNVVSWAGLEVMEDLLVDDIDKRVAATLQGLRSDYGTYSSLYCLDREGRVVASGPHDDSKRDESTAPWFKAVIGGQCCYFDAHRPAGEAIPIVRFSAPIFSRLGDDRPIGALVAKIDPAVIATVLKNLEESRDRLGHPVTVRFIASEERTGFFDGGADGNWVVEEDGGRMAVVGFATARGYRDFPGFGWVLAVAEGTDTALAPLRRLRWLILIVGGGAVLASIGMATVLSANLARPIELMTEAVTHIERSGELSAIPSVLSRDEIGVLSATFNRMVDRLKVTQAKLVQHERLSAVGRMAAEVAHDLATPTTTITNLTRRLLKGSLDGSRQQEQLQLVLDSSGYVQGLVERLLAFARSESPEPLPMSIPGVIADAVRQVGEDVAIDVEVEEELPALVGDATSITRLLFNLLDNAKEAAGPGGRVWVRARQDREAGVVRVEVGDNGPGISEMMRHRLFEPFVTTKGQDGTGLGLAIGYRIAEDHGGRLTLVDGSPGSTTFELRLPIP